MAYKYTHYWEPYEQYIPADYKMPVVSDLKQSFYALPFLIILRFVMEKILHPFASFIFQKKKENKSKENNNGSNNNHNNDGKDAKEDNQSGMTHEMAIKKLTQNMFKFLYYSAAIYLGYHALKDLNYFPYELLGNGDMRNMFTGFPSVLFFQKTEYFDTYYLVSLAYVATDLFFLVFVHDFSSDFYIMFLHHCCTISLISFSFLTQMSHVGAIVLFAHDFTDISVYLVRTLLHTNAHDYAKAGFGIIMILNWIYLRFYVFVKLIFHIIFYYEVWNVFSYNLLMFLIFLVLMHVYWISAILARLFRYFGGSNLEDIGPEKKKVK